MEHVEDLDAYLRKQLGGKPSEDELEEARLKYRVRKLGNVKFIGELYKLHLMPGKVMRKHVLVPLLDKSKDKAASGVVRGAAIEKLVKLLTTIGETLEERDDDLADRCFALLGRISEADDKSLVSRVRFLLLDLLELRDNDWVPRRTQERPQRIGDVHADAAAADADYAYRLPEEQITGMARAAAALPPPRGTPTRTPAEADEDAAFDLCVPQRGDAASEADTGAGAKKAGDKKKVTFGAPQKSPEEQVASMVDELFSSHDTDEAALAFTELGAADNALDLVLRTALEALAPNTDLLADMLLKLHAKREVSRELIDKALTALLDDLADIAVDFPKAPDFVGALLSAASAKKLADPTKLIDASSVDSKMADKVKKALK